MNQDDQPDKSHVIGEMFEPANISQPASYQDVPSGVTPANSDIAVSRPHASTSNNGFTIDNIQPPIHHSDQTQESVDD